MYLTGLLRGFSELIFVKCLKQGLVSCKDHIYVCVFLVNNLWPWILFATSLHGLSVFKFSLENFPFSSWREKKLSTLYIWTTKWFYFRNSPYYAVLVKSSLAILFYLGSSDPIKDWLASEHMFFLLVFPLVGKNQWQLAITGPLGGPM